MSDIVIFIIMTIGGYLIGSIPMAYLVVKLIYKKDIRDFGSGQVGGSNVFRSFSKPLGYAVGIYDGLKGAIIVGIAHWVLDLPIAFQIVIGLAVVSGHNWPVWLKFNAGRGLATTLGVCFVIFPFGIWIFIAFCIFILLIKSSPLPALFGMIAIPTAAWIRHEPSAVVLGLVALFSLTILRRISAPIPERSKNIPKGQLLLNRFLFDRDIRDGKAWISFRAADKKSGKEK
jgi:glycerol-3-phosphate acyltransferase PlsY